MKNGPGNCTYLHVARGCRAGSGAALTVAGEDGWLKALGGMYNPETRRDS